MSSECKSVLIVEDDESIRDILKDCLEFEGYNVVIANHGRAALDLLERTDHPPCLILLDLMMPIMDGWTFLKKRADNDAFKTIPVALVTAAVDKSIESRRDVEVVIRKPVNLKELLNWVKLYCLN